MQQNHESQLKRRKTVELKKFKLLDYYFLFFFVSILSSNAVNKKRKKSIRKLCNLMEYTHVKHIANIHHLMSSSDPVTIIYLLRTR